MCSRYPDAAAIEDKWQHVQCYSGHKNFIHCGVWSDWQKQKINIMSLNKQPIYEHAFKNIMNL